MVIYLHTICISICIYQSKFKYYWLYMCLLFTFSLEVVVTSSASLQMALPMPTACSRKPENSHTTEPTCCTSRHLTTNLRWILNTGYKLPPSSLQQVCYPFNGWPLHTFKTCLNNPLPTSSEQCLFPLRSRPSVPLQDNKSMMEEFPLWPPNQIYTCICICFYLSVNITSTDII